MPDPPLRRLCGQIGRDHDEIQQRLVALQSDVSEVKSGVASANEALKRIETAVDPVNSADRCADLECALTEGASAATVQKLFDKGARLTAHPLILGQLLTDAALTSRPDRFKVLDILVRHGVDLGVPFFPLVALNFPTYAPDELPPELAASEAIKPVSRSSS